MPETMNPTQTTCWACRQLAVRIVEWRIGDHLSACDETYGPYMLFTCDACAGHAHNHAFHEGAVATQDYTATQVQLQHLADDRQAV